MYAHCHGILDAMTFDTRCGISCNGNAMWHQNYTCMVSFQQLKKALHNMKTDVNSRDGSGGALIHSLVERVFSDKRERSEFLLTLLTYSSADINQTNGAQMTALHLTAQVINKC